MAITIHELAVYRGLKTRHDGSYSMGDIHDVGLELLGGCQGCEASIAAYNAYPTKHGFWCCADCVGEHGFNTVDEANAFIFGTDEEFVKWTWQQHAVFYNSRQRGDKVIYVPTGEVCTIAASSCNPACDCYYTLVVGEDLDQHTVVHHTDNINELKPILGATR